MSYLLVFVKRIHDALDQELKAYGKEVPQEVATDIGIEVRNRCRQGALTAICAHLRER